MNAPDPPFGAGLACFWGEANGRHIWAFWAPGLPLATAKCSTAAVTSATMRLGAVNATLAHSTTPPSSPATLRVPVTSRRPEFPCEGVFTGLWGPRRGSWGPPDRSAHAARGRQHVLRRSAREARAACPPGVNTCCSSRDGAARVTGPAHQRERGRRRRYRPVTVTTLRFGSAAICLGQNRSGRSCLLLNSLVWSAKCGDAGLDDSE